MSILKRPVDSSPNSYRSFASWKITPPYLFSSKNIKFAQNELIKVKIFETFKYSGQNLSNSLCQFWNNKSILLRFFYPCSFSWKIAALHFFSSNNIYFSQKDLIKMKISETFKCSDQNSFKFLMSILKWQVNSSSNFASFFIVMTHNSSVNFKLIRFLFWIKGSHQSPNFVTFKCSGENFPYSSCHFSNQKSVFLQILDHP